MQQEKVVFVVLFNDVYVIDASLLLDYLRRQELLGRVIKLLIGYHLVDVMAVFVLNFMAMVMEKVNKRVGWCIPCNRVTDLIVDFTSFLI